MERDLYLDLVRLSHDERLSERLRREIRRELGDQPCGDAEESTGLQPATAPRS
jgi:hypothetical protein